ncbi:MAG: hypothetical protein U1E65_11310 [Myxococcota bacterium]
MLIPPNRAALTFEMGRFESAQEDQKLGHKIAVSTNKEIDTEINQRHDALVKKADKDFDASSGINTFAKIGAIVGAAAVCVATCGAAAPAIAGGLIASGAGLAATAVITTATCLGMCAVPAVLCGALLSLIARGIGTVAMEHNKTEAKDAEQSAGYLALAKKTDEDIAKRSGTELQARGRDDAKQAYSDFVSLLNTKDEA